MLFYQMHPFCHGELLIHCILLSPLIYLQSAAAAAAGIPSAIISNFTFDSCYSYLDIIPSALDDTLEEGDAALPLDVLAPLVQQTIDDYKHASLLLRLPGAIPMPAFDLDAPLPSSKWVDRKSKRFNPEIEALLSRPASQVPCTTGRRKRKVVDTPLVHRVINPYALTEEGRRDILNQIGIPEELQDRERTKILLVSFGGQHIPRPGSRPSTPNGSPIIGEDISSFPSSESPLSTSPRDTLSPQDAIPIPSHKLLRQPLVRLTSENHLYLPGAPPALTHSIAPSPTLASASIPLSPIPIAPIQTNGLLKRRSLRPHAGLLPDAWIAVVCGLSESDLKQDLPKGFFPCCASFSLTFRKD